jgi:hypothetical protein
MQTSSVLSSAVLPQFIQSLTPLGGSGSGSSKERTVEGCVRNAASSFTSQDICIVPIPQLPVPQYPHPHHLVAQPDDFVHSSNQPFTTAFSKEEDPNTRKSQVSTRVGLQSSDQNSIQQQQQAAMALGKYQEFLRQQQQMPPPQSNAQPSNSTKRSDIVMVSIGQQTSQLQVPAGESHAAFHQSTDVAEGPHPLQLRCDSSKTATCDTFTPASAANLDTIPAPEHPRTLHCFPPVLGVALPAVSSQTLSQSLSLNQNFFPSSPSGAQAAASPISSRLPKVLPSGDGRVGFIVLPAGAQVDPAAAAASARKEAAAAHSAAPCLTTSGTGEEEVPYTAQSSTRISTSKRIIEIDISDAETQDSAFTDDGQDETLVIPETPTGTPIQTRIEDRPVSASGRRRPRPQPLRLAHSTDTPKLSSSSNIERATSSSRRTRFAASLRPFSTSDA